MHADPTAAALADFVHALTPAAVPGAMRERALHLALDAIGCAFAARREDFAIRLVDAIGGFAAFEADAGDTASLPPAGRCGVIGVGRRLPLRDAVWLNGVLAHGLDYDDTHMAGVIHLSVSVLPALFTRAPAPLMGPLRLWVELLLYLKVAPVPIWSAPA